MTAELKELADGLPVECEGERSCQNKSKILELSNGGMKLLLTEMGDAGGRAG